MAKNIWRHWLFLHNARLFLPQHFCTYTITHTHGGGGFSSVRQYLYLPM